MKSSGSPTFPVSKKAYAGFIDRIRCVFSSDSSRADMMVAVLDRYLGGDSNAADALDASMRPAFEFLRHDVDKAIERSSRARLRAYVRKHRVASENTGMDQATPAADPEEILRKLFANTDDDAREPVDMDSDKTSLSRPLTRRQRRARERAARGKSRYKRLGAAS